VAAYRAARPGIDVDDLITAVTSDHGFRIPAIRLAQARATAATAPVFSYLITWGLDHPGPRRTAPHGVETPLVFDCVADEPHYAARDGAQIMAVRVRDAWIAFARTGVPSGADLPVWPAYSRDDRATMVLDDVCRVEVDPFSRERLAWEPFTDRQLGLCGELT
jgi:para-nitrobenzyl esterase